MRSSAVLLLAMSFLAGCNYQKHTNPPPPSPLADKVAPFAQPPSEAPPAERQTEAWWEAFGDQTLSALIEESLQHSYSARSGWALVRQARALAHQARAARFPFVGVEGSASRASSLTPVIGDVKSTNLVGSLPVSFELDVFARRAREHQAFKLDAEAARSEQRTLLISVSAEVAEAWYDLVDALDQQRVLNEQVATNERVLELVELRYREGLAPVVDAHQQRQLVAGAKANLALFDAVVSLNQDRLAALLGDMPGREFSTQQATLPTLKPPPVTEVPASYLRLRPDVSAAQLRVEASDRRVAAAIGARLPQITLSYTPSYTYLKSEGRSFTDPTMKDTRTTEGFTWTAGARLSVPLFDGRLGKAQIDAQRAVLDQAVDQYAQTILTALLEVRSALVQERQQRVNIDNLTEQLRLARATLAATKDRYTSGLSDFLPVLTALATAQRTELELLSAQRALVSSRIQLHRALGGDWPTALEEPPR